MDHSFPTAADLAPAEKVSLTAGLDYWYLGGVPRLGIEPILVCDGPHGLRKQRRTSGFEAESIPATCFPTACTLAASWDVDLIREVGVALGQEARAEGVSVLLGPGANIKRTALCGRNFEYFAEDPHLSSRLAAAWIQGVQSTGVGASLKHFAANNCEHRRYVVDSLVDERALREIYLASFEYAVRTARPMTVMAAYNRLNGPYCTNHRELLSRVLRDEWGFDGAVISDWGATNGRAASVCAGLDVAMPGFAGADDAEVSDALAHGTLTAAELDRAATAVLRLVERTAAARAGGYSYDAQAHHALARRAAAAGTVLLRNERGVLPLVPGGSVAVIGAFAKVPRYQGAGSSGLTPHQIDNAYDALAEQLGADRVRYADGYRRDGTGDSEVDQDLIRSARAVAARADTAVVFVGLPELYEIEGLDRNHIDLPRSHDALVEAIAAEHPRVVVVLANGSPVAMPWLGSVAAVVEGYLGGQAGGSAIADVLTGQVEPGGRLAETFPHRVGDNPVHAMPTGPRQVEYRESVYVGYRYYDSAGVGVAFPFGFGLSYTTFSWSAARVQGGSEDVAFEVSVTVTNTGSRAGSEVVQLYVHDVQSTVFRPRQELKAFAKVHLEPGESQEVVLALDRRAFAFWDVRAGDWAVENGEFELRLGQSCQHIRAVLTVTVRSASDGPFAPGPGSYHRISAATGFDRDTFADLYGQPLPANVVDHRGQYTINTPLADLRHPAAWLLLGVLRLGARFAFGRPRSSAAGLVAASTINQATPRMLPMMFGARAGAAVGQALVDLANRRYREFARRVFGRRPR